MVSGLSEDFRDSLRMVIAEVANLNTKLNPTMRAVGDQTPTGVVARFNKIKVPELKPLCGVRDAKALENRAVNTVTEEVKETLATMHLADDAKLWWRSKCMNIQDGLCTMDKRRKIGGAKQ